MQTPASPIYYAREVLDATISAIHEEENRRTRKRYPQLIEDSPKASVEITA
jgi:hypothetical protein